MPPKRTKRRKKIKYKSISMKVSANQYSTLQRYCAKYKLTPNKVIKKALRVYMDRFGPVLDNHSVKVSENQLTIFDAGAEDGDDAATASGKLP
jgi:hypothetical protein